jgi:hypothetical protein
MSTDRPPNRQGQPWQSILSGSGFYGQGRGQVPPDQIRISDAERHEMTETLAKHYAEGRLDQSEMDERVTKAMGAKTRGDLRGLLDDLPPLGPASGPVAVPASRSRRPFSHRVLFILLAVFLVASLSAALSSPWHVPWVLFLVIGFLLLRGPLRFHDHTHHGPHVHGRNGDTYV